MAQTLKEILSKGQNINAELQSKIKLLDDRNSNFKEQLTDKLKKIIDAIEKFKSTNLQGLTETKTKLSEVTAELDTAKQNLQATQTQLTAIQEELKTTKQLLEKCSATKNSLDQQVAELNKRLQEMDTEYNNKINGVRQEMVNKSTQEKKAMQEQFEAEKAAIESEKTNLTQQIETSQAEQTAAINKLESLQKEQADLVNSLGSINAFLDAQLELIQKINTDDPKLDDYESLLDTIQSGLSGVIGEINEAVTNKSAKEPQQENARIEVKPIDKFLKLSKPTQNEILQKNFKPEYRDKFINYPNNSTPKDELNILLTQNQSAMRDINKASNPTGGKRRRKTMRKKQKKTHKRRNLVNHKKLVNRKLSQSQSGGYVYSSNKKLDDASSIVSASSENVKTRSKSKRKDKTKRRSKY